MKKSSLLSQVLKKVSEKKVFEIRYACKKVLLYMSYLQFPSMGIFNQDLKMQDPCCNVWEFFYPFIKNSLSQGQAGKRLGSVVTQKVLALCEDYKDVIKEKIVVSSLVHGDFNGKNILLHYQHWNIEAILDGEFACAGFFLTDFGNILRYNASFFFLLKKDW